jgi:hypothetical protein
MSMEQRRIELEALLRLLKSAVGELLRLQDEDAFLSWMQSQAPERFPEIFSGVDERVVRPLALELGRQIWNATPLPRNGFKPLVLPRPAPLGDQDPPAIPGLTPELIGALITALLAEAAERAQGGVDPEQK